MTLGWVDLDPRPAKRLKQIIPLTFTYDDARNVKYSHDNSLIILGIGRDEACARVEAYTNAFASVEAKEAVEALDVPLPVVLSGFELVESGDVEVGVRFSGAEITISTRQATWWSVGEGFGVDGKLIGPLPWRRKPRSHLQ
ncbi:hypothetical protein ACLOJK_035919 [Asimina triloba]